MDEALGATETIAPIFGCTGERDAGRPEYVAVL